MDIRKILVLGCLAAQSTKWIGYIRDEDEGEEKERGLRGVRGGETKIARGYDGSRVSFLVSSGETET